MTTNEELGTRSAVTTEARTAALSQAQRHKLLHDAEADLLWLTLEDRWVRARKVLSSREMQAAVVAARDYTRPLVSGTGAEKPDPTFRAADHATATELRAGQVVTVWTHEIETIRQHVWFVADATALLLDETMPPARIGRGIAPAIRSCSERITWLLAIGHEDGCRLDRALAACDDDERIEIDISITEAAADAKALRDGVLYTDDLRKVPSVYAVLETARQAMRVQRSVPQPIQPQAPEGCISCRRDGGYFEPICTDRYDAKSLCRSCGDFLSGQGRLPPLGAIKYVHRTGKRLTAKVVMDADRAEQRQGA